MRTTLLSVTLLSACAHGLPGVQEVPEGGTRIYSGEARGPKGAAMFVYTRDSRIDGSRWTSIHRSYDATTGELVVAQAARHDATYSLEVYLENHLQLGLRSIVSASAPGRLEYTTTQGDRVRHRSERIDAPAVTGPTLFGFIRTHWETLARGESVDVRFVVAEHRRSYRFELRMSEDARVQMRARSPLLRLFVPPMRMRFDPDTRTIAEYDGRIPPRRDGRPTQARVVYQHAAAFR